MTGSVIVISTTKGGAGKTTLALCLAAQWHTDKKSVGVIDADPQESLASVIGDAKMPIGLHAEPGHEKLTAAVAELRGKYDRLIVDTAGFQNRTALYAMAEADLVLIPCRTARVDIDQLVKTYKLIREIERTPERGGRPLTLRAVVTQANPRTMVAAWTRKALDEAGIPMTKTEVSNRAIYQEISFTGDLPALTAPTSPAASEIRRLAREVDKILDAA